MLYGASKAPFRAGMLTCVMGITAPESLNKPNASPDRLLQNPAANHPAKPVSKNLEANREKIRLKGKKLFN